MNWAISRTSVETSCQYDHDETRVGTVLDRLCAYALSVFVFLSSENEEEDEDDSCKYDDDTVTQHWMFCGDVRMR